MELALIVIGQMASHDERANPSIFRLDVRGGPELHGLSYFTLNLKVIASLRLPEPPVTAISLVFAAALCGQI